MRGFEVNQDLGNPGAIRLRSGADEDVAHRTIEHDSHIRTIAADAFVAMQKSPLSYEGMMRVPGSDPGQPEAGYGPL